MDARGDARGEDDVDDVAFDFLVDVNLLYHFLGFNHLFGLEQGRHLGTLAGDVLAYDEFFLFLAGIADDHLEQETVDLCFGQGVGAFLLDGVLRGHHHERLVEGEGVVADGDLALLHGFEQGALHLGGGAVDFVGEHEVGENRAFLYLELFALDAVDHGADYVGGEQVGRELDAAVARIDELREGFDGKGLCKAGDAFEEHVAVAEQSDEQALHEVLLAHDGLVHAVGDEIDEVGLGCYQRIELADIDGITHKCSCWVI